MPTEDGQKTARSRVLRADNLQDLSAADVRKLVHDIGVTTVVDLRSSNELAAEGPAPLDAVAINLSLIGHFKPMVSGSVFLSDIGYFVTASMLALFLTAWGLAQR